LLALEDGDSNTPVFCRSVRYRFSGNRGPQLGKKPKPVPPNLEFVPTPTSRKCWTQEKPDLAFLSLPNDGHFQPTLEVIRAGVPLFVEKTAGVRLEGSRPACEEAADRKLFFGINFNHHYARPVAMAHHAVQQGRLGDLTFATWRFGGEGGTSHPFNNLFETQCHAFDMFGISLWPD